MSWPEVTLDRIEQLRVLARVLPGVALHERTIEAPFEVVWGFLSDLRNSVPQFDRDVSSIEIVEQHGERLTIRSRSPFVPLAVTFDVDLREGWCWMVARPQLYVVGMAAVPDGEHTRFAMLEGVSLTGPEPLRPLLRPVHVASSWRHRRHLAGDVDRIERALGLRAR